MIRADDVDKILGCWVRDDQSVPEWCRRNDVDEGVMHWLASVYGFSTETAGIAIVAFRLGYEARRESEQRSAARA